ncbi:hypothetical protein [Algoriphagus mannitolivorans]|uniref:hypothetical protein n=1 Tax=Algoriphagus mannitolivorans TaxID=226504 RepID=UPI000412DBE1|nr:hypothetical protein [Algoriphagus mannitolivorans]
MDHYFNQVLDAFSKMDRDKLEELLEPSLSYQDVSFPAFLDGLERIFSKFRQAGDDFLEVQSGHCCSLGCNPDKIRTAYRFVGNTTRDYLDLRFILELTEDLKDHRVLDIFQCHELKCQEPSDWYGRQRLLRFYFDEESPEKVGVEEKLQTQIALEAMKTLEELPFFELDDAKAWIMTYAGTYNTLQKAAHDRGHLFTEYRWQSFKDYYQYLRVYLEVYGVLKSSGDLQEVFFWELLPDSQLFQKIRKVERLLVDHYGYFILRDEVEEKVQIPGGEKINLGGAKFDQLEAFWRKFFEIQKPLLDRFFVFTEREEETYLMETFDLIDNYSLSLLSFHLDYRERFRQEGKGIPEWRRKTE